MTRCVCLGIMGAVLTLMGLGCNDSSTQPKQVQLTFLQSDCHREGDTRASSPAGEHPGSLSLLSASQSPCLDGHQSASTLMVSSPRSVRFAAGHDTLFVYHDSAWYNCCSKIRFNVEIQDSVVDFIEADTAKTLCNCMCHFDLASCLWGLSRGTYSARLWTENRDSLLGEAAVFVPGTDQIWFDTRCDTLTFHHDGRLANCGAKFIFRLEQQGNLLAFTEADTSSLEYHCECNFDLVAQVSGLTGGQYTIQVRDAKADSLLGTGVVQIDPCLPH